MRSVRREGERVSTKTLGRRGMFLDIKDSLTEAVRDAAKEAIAAGELS